MEDVSSCGARRRFASSSKRTPRSRTPCSGAHHGVLQLQTVHQEDFLQADRRGRARGPFAAAGPVTHKWRSELVAPPVEERSGDDPAPEPAGAPRDVLAGQDGTAAISSGQTRDDSSDDSGDETDEVLEDIAPTDSEDEEAAIARASRRVRYGTDDANQNEIVFSTTAVYASYSRRTHPSRHGSSWVFVRKATRDDDTHSMCQTLLSSPTSSLATNAAPDPAPCFHDNRKSYRRWFSCLRFNSSRP